MTLILNSQAYDGISLASHDLNWLNRVGSTETLTSKKYLQIKNFNVERVPLIDRDQKLQRNGLNSPACRLDWRRANVLLHRSVDWLPVPLGSLV